jgi:ribonuclease P protein component
VGKAAFGRVTRAQFEDIFRNGKRLGNAYFQLCFISNQSIKKPNIVAVVSKKVFALATKRNQLKRRMREVMRRGLAHYSHGSVIVFAKPATSKANFAIIEKYLSELLKQIMNS